MNPITKLEEIGAIRTLTRDEYRALARTDRNEWQQRANETPRSGHYMAMGALREQVAGEIAPTLRAVQEARRYCFQHADDKLIDPLAPVVSGFITPPPINEDLTVLTDKDGPKQKAALAKLERINPKLKERLDKQLRPRLAYLASLK